MAKYWTTNLTVRSHWPPELLGRHHWGILHSPFKFYIDCRPCLEAALKCSIVSQKVDWKGQFVIAAFCLHLQNGWEWEKGRRQCDQKASVFFQNLAIYDKENLPNGINVCQSRFKFCQIINNPSKKYKMPKMFKILAKYGEISPNLVAWQEGTFMTRCRSCQRRKRTVWSDGWIFCSIFGHLQHLLNSTKKLKLVIQSFANH